jgi:hypothetical protein
MGPAGFFLPDLTIIFWYNTCRYWTGGARRDNWQTVGLDDSGLPGHLSLDPEGDPIFRVGKAALPTLIPSGSGAPPVSLS